MTGSGFDTNALVYIGGLLTSNIDVVSDSAIVATTPTALEPGTHDISIVNSDNQTTSLSSGYTVTEEKDTAACSSSSLDEQWWLLFALSIFVYRRDR